jgi:apolipoprotein N-acyltransferase
LGVAVCYEIVFPGEVAALVEAGATVLVTVTNDAWYGDTAAPWQHLAAARFRAAELRRPLVRAAITGVSAVIDPHGRVLRQAGVNERGTLPISLWGRLEQTPAARWPWLGPALMVLLTAVGWISTRR